MAKAAAAARSEESGNGGDKAPTNEYAVDSCHPRPGVDCAAWCAACKLLGRVPADVLAEARQQLRERGLDR